MSNPAQAGSSRADVLPRQHTLRCFSPSSINLYNQYTTLQRLTLDIQLKHQLDPQSPLLLVPIYTTPEGPQFHSLIHTNTHISTYTVDAPGTGVRCPVYSATGPWILLSPVALHRHMRRCKQGSVNPRTLKSLQYLA